MPLDTVNNTLNVLYAILYSMEKAYGVVDTNAWVRIGLVSQADMQSVRSGYLTWKQTFTNRGPSEAGATTAPPVRTTEDVGGGAFVTR